MTTLALSDALVSHVGTRVDRTAIDDAPAAPALTAVVLANEQAQRDVARALQGLNIRAEYVVGSGNLIARIESTCLDILVVDLDLMPGPDDLARLARSLHPDIRIVAIQWCWTERDGSSFADGILHKPARHDEWLRAMARLRPSGIASRGHDRS